MTAPEPTNDAVSDERLRTLALWAEPLSVIPPADGHAPFVYGEIASICRELLNRRSVTSQASEGAVDEGYSVDHHAYRVAHIPEPAPVAPVSKRVERLETALKALLDKLDECEPHTTAAFQFRQLHGFAYDGPNYAAEKVVARQALQGGRS